MRSERPKRRWPMWPWLVLTVAGVMITLVAAVVGAAARSTPSTAAGPAPTTVTRIQLSTTTVTATVTLPPPPGPSRLITNGLHEVGVEVLPGRYQTAGPDGSNPGGCYWSRATNGGTLIDNGRLTDAGTITLSAAELIDSNGCQMWHQVP